MAAARRAREAALARHFPKGLCVPLDAALALYAGMASKSPGLALHPKSSDPGYGGLAAEILASQDAFAASGYSLRGDSLEAVAGLIGDAGLCRVLEFGPGVSTLVLPRRFEGQIETWLSIEENAEYAARLATALAGHPAYGVVSLQCLAISEEAGPVVARPDGTPFRAAGFEGLRAAFKSAFGARPPDLVLIDGPSGAARWGRFAALADLVDVLAPGTLVLLDDALRHREVSILQEWRSRGLVEVDGIFCIGAGLAVARVMA
jgi:predicted O-methyltransferase YrrM